MDETLINSYQYSLEDYFLVEPIIVLAGDSKFWPRPINGAEFAFLCNGDACDGDLLEGDRGNGAERSGNI